MKILRCSRQGPQSLADYFASVFPDGDVMMPLLTRLEAVPFPQPIWVLTSVGELLCGSEDDLQAIKHVAFGAVENHYAIRYRIPGSPNWTEWSCTTEDEAATMILAALERSEGWSNLQQDPPRTSLA